MTDASKPREPRYRIQQLQDWQGGRLAGTGFWYVQRRHNGQWDALTVPLPHAEALSECERLRRIDSGNLSWAEFRRYSGQV